jgi:hypothetical protein
MSDGRREQSNAAVAEHDDDEGQSRRDRARLRRDGPAVRRALDGEVAQVDAGWRDDGDGFCRRPRYSPSLRTVEQPLARGEHLNRDVLIELGVEDDCWLVSLVGFFVDRPPGDLDGCAAAPAVGERVDEFTDGLAARQRWSSGRRRGPCAHRGG